MSYNTIKLESISKKYESMSILHNISFNFSSPNIYTIFGKNGVGKTTLLNLICKNIPVSSGSISVTSEDIIFVKNNDIPFYYFTGLEFITFTLKLKKKYYSQKKLEYLIKEFSLEEHINKYIKSYSDGMKSKLFYIIIIISKPNIILLDEPFSELDLKTQKIVFEHLKKLRSTSLIIISTHNLKFSTELESEVLLLSDKLNHSTIENVKISIMKN